MTKLLFAKSDDDTTLYQHSEGVTRITDYLFKRLIRKDISWNDDNDSTDDFYKEVITAAALHDIGKCSKRFQEYIRGKKSKKTETTQDGLIISNGDNDKKKNDEVNFVHHNVLAWAYLNKYRKISSIVKTNILYHHVVIKPLWNEATWKSIMAIEEKNDKNLDAFNEFYDYMVSYCADTYGVTINKEFCKNKDDASIDISLYQLITPEDLYSDLDESSKYLILRALIVFADRYVSAHYSDIDLICKGDKDYLDNMFNTVIDNPNLPNDEVNLMKDSDGNYVYDVERLASQNDVLEKINSSDNCIVSASAGFGKTLVGLRWILQNKKKTLWVVPRNVIAQGTYDQICTELEKMGYSNKVSVGMLIGGEWLSGDINSDIIVTNIDNFLSMMIKNNMVDNLLKEIGGNIIFDEYHEFLGKEGLFAGFIEMVYTRCKMTNSKTLLLSATPLHFEKKYFKNIIHFTEATPYNGKMNVKIEYHNLKSIRELFVKSKDSFVICNTVKQSQTAFKELSKNSDDDILIHSRFPRNRRNELENKIYEFHGKNSDVKCRNNVFGTNIIGVGLDISAKHIYDFVITPENTIQRGCGRGGRFNESEYKNEIEYHVCELSKKTDFKRIIESQTSEELSDKWLQILKKYDGRSITKDDLYKLYNKYYEENDKDINVLWDDFLKESSEKLMKLRPYKVISSETTKSKLSQCNGYRGTNDSIYVTVKYKDGYCEPIIVDKKRICDDDKVVTNTKEKYLKYLKKTIDNKHKIKTITEELLFSYALNEETPLLLEYSSYDDKMGLALNDKKISVEDKDDDVEID